MPKNKAAFSLSSHLGLDWSFRTTASPVIVHRRVRGTSRGSSRFISTSCSSGLTIRVTSRDRLGSSLLRVRYLGLSLHSGRIPSYFEFLRMRELGRPRARSSDAQPTNQRTGCSPTANQLKRLHQVQEAAQTMLQLPRQPNQPEK